MFRYFLCMKMRVYCLHISMKPAGLSCYPWGNGGEKVRVVRMIATFSSVCVDGHRSRARTIRRRDRGYALPFCGLPPRHTVLSLTPGWPVDPIATKSVPSAYLSPDAPRPCDSEAGAL